MRLSAIVGLLLLLTGCGAGPSLTVSTSRSVECAPFARQVSGIQIYGAAHTWWDQAEGRYARGSEPVEGGVLVFRRSERLPSGHVSVVARRISDREIRVTQANWVHHRVTRDEPVLDVSPANDWSLVRVWWEPVQALGSTTYPVFGFVAPTLARPRPNLVAGLQAP